MKILVTGSSGFIGSALVLALRAEGYAVCGIDIRRPRWREVDGNDVHQDITDHAGLLCAVQAFQPEAVVHLAARTDISADSVVQYNANIEGVANLLHAVQRTRSVRRVLWTSTQLVSRVGRVPAHDTDYDPDTSYGESKVVGERIVRSGDGGCDEWAILRPTTVWGPGMSDHYLSLLRYLERGRYFHAGGRPTPKSFAYIGNTVAQLRALLTTPAARLHRQTFYIADYEAIDMRQWCDALSTALGVKPSPIVPLPVARALARVGDTLNATVAPGFKFNSFRLRNILTSYVFDNRNLQAITGALPVDASAAVRATVDWYRQAGRAGLVGSAGAGQ